LDHKATHGHYIESMDRQIISKENTFLLLSRGDLKGQAEKEIIVVQDQALQAKYHATKLLQTETGTNEDSVNNLMRQWNTSYLHVQY
jgi:hypothetical protein